MISIFRKVLLFKRFSKKSLCKLFTAFETFGLDALLISTIPDCKNGRLFYMTCNDEIEGVDGVYLSAHRLLSALKTELSDHQIDLDFSLDVRNKEVQK